MDEPRLRITPALVTAVPALIPGALALAALFTPACKTPTRCLVEGRDAAGPATCPPPMIAAASGPATAVARSYEEAARAAGSYWTSAARTEAIASGVAVINKHQCTRCHEVDGQKGIGRPFDCVSCHVFIKGLTPDDRRYKKIAKKHGKDTIDRYIRNIEHQLRIPSLDAIGKRVRPEWTRSFLPAPYDLRPVFDESMIRNQLTATELDSVIRYFAAIADIPDPARADYRPTPLPAKPTAARITAGKETFIARACPTCHLYGKVDFGETAKALFDARDNTLFAPNLLYARDRIRPEVMVDWIVDPKIVQAAATMPAFAVPREEAEAIRDYLYFGDPGEPEPALPARPLLALPPAVDHDVAWAEVKERVLGHVCVHCHMNDHELDTGPGNKGGLGYPGIGLAFRTYERIVWGAVDKNSKRRYSVMKSRPGDSMPRLLLALVARRVEHRRDNLQPFEHRELPDFPDDVLGMPMGLPTLSDEQIGIVRKWIEQGCRGQNEVTGKPGFTDGFLVPDGPIARNQGCEVRRPVDPPPEWNTAPRPE